MEEEEEERKRLESNGSGCCACLLHARLNELHAKRLEGTNSLPLFRSKAFRSACWLEISSQLGFVSTSRDGRASVVRALLRRRSERTTNGAKKQRKQQARTASRAAAGNKLRRPNGNYISGALMSAHNYLV